MYLGQIYQTKEREFKVSDMETHPDTEATIKVRLLSPGERKTAVMAGLKTVYNADDSGAFVPEMKSEHHKSIEELFMKSVTGWTGFYEDEAGNVPLKFGVKGKTMLLSVIPEIADFVANCHKTMVDEEAERLEQVNKNLSKGSSASGTRTSQTVTGAEK